MTLGPSTGSCIPTSMQVGPSHSFFHQALARLESFSPYRIPGPIQLVQRLREPYSPAALESAQGSPWVDVVDDRTLAYEGQNVVEAFARRCGMEYTWRP